MFFGGVGDTVIHQGGGGAGAGGIDGNKGLVETANFSGSDRFLEITICLTWEADNNIG